jgi:hypothetical protein
MKIQELSLPDYPRCILGPESATGSVRSTDRPHLTTILRDMARAAGISKDNADFSEEDLDWYAADGFMWERVWDMAHADAIERGELVSIGEIECDGIVGTPDRVDFTRPAVIELKHRWRSVRSLESPERNYWIEIAQVKSYCHMLQILEADLIIWFCNGDYKPPKPCVRGLNLRFTERELAEQWDAIKRFAVDKGYLTAPTPAAVKVIARGWDVDGSGVNLVKELPPPSPPPRIVSVAPLVPADPAVRPHAKQLGQITGGTQDQNDAEALRLLKMIGSVDWQRDGVLDDWLYGFVDKQFTRQHVLGEDYSVTGHELFRLRDAWAVLIEKGLT